MSKLVIVIGMPVSIDVKTTTFERATYTRCLVEVFADKDLPKLASTRLPLGALIEEEVVYEWVPPKCSKCVSFDHSVEQCPTKQVWVPKEGDNSRDSPSNLNGKESPSSVFGVGGLSSSGQMAIVPFEGMHEPQNTEASRASEFLSIKWGDDTKQGKNAKPREEDPELPPSSPILLGWKRLANGSTKQMSACPGPVKTYLPSVDSTQTSSSKLKGHPQDMEICTSRSDHSEPNLDPDVGEDPEEMLLEDVDLETKMERIKDFDLQSLGVSSEEIQSLHAASLEPNADFFQDGEEWKK